jgi:dihydrofolate reductase
MIHGIMACDKNGGIGKNNLLPWGRIKEDMEFFKRKTLNNNIVMGKNTYLSIGKPLSQRNNIVLSNTLKDDRVLIYKSIDDILNNIEDFFVIGGKQIYNQFEKYYNIFYLTIINEVYDCDTFVDTSFLKNYYQSCIFSNSLIDIYEYRR